MTVTVSNPTGTSGLVASYAFEEASGATTADQTGLGHTGTISGATRSTLGKNGRALSFDGNADWVTVADANDLDLTTSMTLEAWVYPTTTNNVWRAVVAKERARPGLRDDGAVVIPGRPYAVISTTGEQLAQGPTTLPANTWAHMAATYDGSALRFYINGALVTTKAAIGSITTTNLPLHIGGDALNEWFNGRIDDVRIYNRTLTQAEIKADLATPAG